MVLKIVIAVCLAIATAKCCDLDWILDEFHDYSESEENDSSEKPTPSTSTTPTAIPFSSADSLAVTKPSPVDPVQDLPSTYPNNSTAANNSASTAEGKPQAKYHRRLAHLRRYLIRKLPLQNEGRGLYSAAEELPFATRYAPNAQLFQGRELPSGTEQETHPVKHVTYLQSPEEKSKDLRFAKVPEGSDLAQSFKDEEHSQPLLGRSRQERSIYGNDRVAATNDPIFIAKGQTDMYPLQLGKNLYADVNGIFEIIPSQTRNYLYKTRRPGIPTEEKYRYTPPIAEEPTLSSVTEHPKSTADDDGIRSLLRYLLNNHVHPSVSEHYQPAIAKDLEEPVHHFVVGHNNPPIPTEYLQKPSKSITKEEIGHTVVEYSKPTVHSTAIENPTTYLLEKYLTSSLLQRHHTNDQNSKEWAHSFVVENHNPREQLQGPVENISKQNLRPSLVTYYKPFANGNDVSSPFKHFLENYFVQSVPDHYQTTVVQNYKEHVCPTVIDTNRPVVNIEYFHNPSKYDPQKQTWGTFNEDYKPELSTGYSEISPEVQPLLLNDNEHSSSAKQITEQNIGTLIAKLVMYQTSSGGEKHSHPHHSLPVSRNPLKGNHLKKIEDSQSVNYQVQNLAEATSSDKLNKEKNQNVSGSSVALNGINHIKEYVFREYTKINPYDHSEVHNIEAQLHSSSIKGPLLHPAGLKFQDNYVLPPQKPTQNNKAPFINNVQQLPLMNSKTTNFLEEYYPTAPENHESNPRFMSQKKPTKETNHREALQPLPRQFVNDQLGIRTEGYNYHSSNQDSKVNIQTIHKSPEHLDVLPEQNVYAVLNQKPEPQQNSNDHIQVPNYPEKYHQPQQHLQMPKYPNIGFQSQETIDEGKEPQRNIEIQQKTEDDDGHEPSPVSRGYGSGQNYQQQPDSINLEHKNPLQNYNVYGSVPMYPINNPKVSKLRSQMDADAGDESSSDHSHNDQNLEFYQQLPSVTMPTNFKAGGFQDSVEIPQEQSIHTHPNSSTIKAPTASAKHTPISVV